MPKHQLGILLVHGIGTQPSAESLVRWGDALVKTIRQATNQKVVVKVKTATSERDEEESGPASAVVSLEDETAEKTWLIADGWWADVFLPPSYKELVSWSTRALPWAIALHIAQSHWQTSEQKGWRRPYLAALTVVKLLAALLLAPLFVFILALSLLLGALPIPQLRSILMAAQGTLVSTVGDSLAFVESPIRGALIRTRLLKDIGWLKDRCEKTIIVAHSQGAAVVLDALGAIDDQMDDRKRGTGNSAGELIPNTLVTFGAGTNQLTCLKKLAAGMPKRFGFNPVNCAMAAMVISCAILAGLTISVLQQHTTVRQILITAAGLGGCFALAFGLGMVGRKLIAWLGTHFHSIRVREEKIALSCIGVGIPVLILLGIFAAKKTQLPLLSVSLLYYVLIFLLAGIYLVLSKEMMREVTLVSMPEKLERWFDFYASADPVPNGPTRTAAPAPAGERFRSMRIFNEGSAVSDHGSYWENVDGFVLRVVRICALTANSSWQQAISPENNLVEERARWRIRCLRIGKSISLMGWIAVGIGLWIHHAPAVPALFTPPGWLPEGLVPLARFATLAAIIAFAGRCTSAVIYSIWKAWRRSEMSAAMNSPSERVPTELWLLLLALPYSITLWLAFCAATDRWHTLADSSKWKDFAFPVLALAILFCYAQNLFRTRPLKESQNP